MDLNPYLSTLRESLATTAGAGDEQLQRAAAVLAATLEPAARLTLMNALSDLAAEVTAQLPDHVVEVRLDGRDVRVVVTGGSAAGQTREPPQPPPPPPP
ncbi:toxin-antitoxin system HicB family antitoxin, partial [Saccharomonospora xinjiangensis]